MRIDTRRNLSLGRNRRAKRKENQKNPYPRAATKMCPRMGASGLISTLSALCTANTHDVIHTTQKTKILARKSNWCGSFIAKPNARVQPRPSEARPSAGTRCWASCSLSEPWILRRFLLNIHAVDSRPRSIPPPALGCAFCVSLNVRRRCIG